MSNVNIRYSRRVHVQVNRVGCLRAKIGDYSGMGVISAHNSQPPDNFFVDLVCTCCARAVSRPIDVQSYALSCTVTGALLAVREVYTVPSLNSQSTSGALSL
jgi:hypothetical protein